MENIGEVSVILILYPGKSSNLLTDEAYISSTLEKDYNKNLDQVGNNGRMNKGKSMSLFLLWSGHKKCDDGDLHMLE